MVRLADEPRADAEFLAGFIALRMLHDPATAEKHFRRWRPPTRRSPRRGHITGWPGRRRRRAGRAGRNIAKAAAWPTTFYGQLAALALGETPAGSVIAKLHDPGLDPGHRAGVHRHEVLRAAAWLIAWGDPQRARVFLTADGRTGADPGRTRR